VAEEKRENLKEMHLLDHLEELRSALIWSFLVWFVASAVLGFFSRQILDFLITELPVKKLYFYAPAEAFMIRMKLSFIFGFLASFPYVFFRVWRFISPGLFARERRLVQPLIVSSVVLFYGGLVFAYLVMMPIVLNFFVRFGSDYLTPLLSVERYFGFVGKLCFAFGLVFQLPLIIIVLSWIGMISARALLRQWRWVIVVVFSVSAVLTPPDPISQICMAVPLCVLYFGSVIIALAIEKGRKAEDAGETEK
jgi:sec-independent protein translocase protein TatC